MTIKNSVKRAGLKTSAAVMTGTVKTIEGLQAAGRGTKKAVHVTVIDAPKAVADKASVKVFERKAIRAARRTFKESLIEEGAKVLAAERAQEGVSQS